MRRSRFLILPSLSEGMPKALLEAMSQGMHLIVNRTLKFPADIMARVDSVDIQDWDAVEELLKKKTSFERDAGNASFAAEYLAGSTRSLFDAYDLVYEAAQRSRQAGR
jgi:hypothetical protein